MGLHIDWLAVDAADPEKLARFWCAALGYEIVHDGDDPEDGDHEVLIVGGSGGLRMLFLENRDEKVVKNRLHLDFRPDDQEAEVKRLLDLGATEVDIGQGDRSWTVLADPEGNEFCVLRAGTPEELEERKQMEAQGKW